MAHIVFIQNKTDSFSIMRNNPEPLTKQDKVQFYTFLAKTINIYKVLEERKTKVFLEILGMD